MDKKRYKITIIYPNKYPIERDITGRLFIEDNHYLIIFDKGTKKIFLPMMFTVIEEINEEIKRNN